MKRIDYQASRAEKLDPLTVRKMKFNAATSSFCAGRFTLRTQEFSSCGFISVRLTHGDQDARGMKH
jgi:hypothetical protein